MRAAWTSIALAGLLVLAGPAGAEEVGAGGAPSAGESVPIPVPNPAPIPAPEPVPPGWVTPAPVRSAGPSITVPILKSLPLVPGGAPPASLAAEPPRGQPRSYDRYARPGSPRSVSRPLRDRARGPFEIRDEFLLAQPRMTLPAVSPDPLCCGEWFFRFSTNWGNDFGWTQTGAAESPNADVRFMVDGEHRTYDLVARYGITRSLGVGIRVPVHWRGGGFMDGIIDWWHEKFGFQDNGRSEFDTNRYRVLGRDAEFERYAWTEQGFGLGNLELQGSWAFLAPRRRCDLRAALVGRVGVPTGSGPYETGSVDAGLQIAAAKQLGRRFDLYAGVGGTYYSKDSIEGVLYEPWRAYGFAALEYRVSPLMSLIVQTDASSRMITNLVDYPALQWYLQIGGRVDLSPRVQLFAGFTENFLDQNSTVDVGVWGGLEFRL